MSKPFVETYRYRAWWRYAEVAITPLVIACFVSLIEGFIRSSHKDLWYFVGAIIGNGVIAWLCTADAARFFFAKVELERRKIMVTDSLGRKQAIRAFELEAVAAYPPSKLALWGAGKRLVVRTDIQNWDQLRGRIFELGDLDPSTDFATIAWMRRPTGKMALLCQRATRAKTSS